MSRLWEDFEDKEVIEKWRDEKVEFVKDGKKTIYISRRLLCNILERLSAEGSVEIREEFDTEFVDGKGWVPPVEIWREKDGTRARKRPDDEVIDPFNYKGRGRTVGEIKKFRKESGKIGAELEDFFDICPRCKCPSKHCSAHC